MTLGVRRIVTGHNEFGMGIIVSDEMLSAVSRGLGANISGCEIWSTNSMPVDNSMEAEAWILERSATGLREADLNVLSKLGNQGLEGRLEPEAFTGGEVGREDDLLDVLVGCPVYI